MIAHAKNKYYYGQNYSPLNVIYFLRINQHILSNDEHNNDEDATTTTTTITTTNTAKATLRNQMIYYNYNYYHYYYYYFPHFASISKGFPSS